MDRRFCHEERSGAAVLVLLVVLTAHMHGLIRGAGSLAYVTAMAHSQRGPGPVRLADVR
jgi:hypothetical protein